jgi:Glycosyltransferase (GlcNAc)
LSHGWSSSFSFSKCHFEETVPYDPFSYGVTDIEQFSRYVRLWTRGYDTYTPTTNIVYDDNDSTNNTTNKLQSTINTNDQYRIRSINRAKIIAQIPILDGTVSITPTETTQANLGIYGLGKRRSIQQLNEFLHMDIQHSQSSSAVQCENNTWIPYDRSILPTTNLYNEPDNLEPQPIYPLRTRLLYYQQEVVYNADLGDVADHEQQQLFDSDYEYHHHHYHQLITKDPFDDMPSLTSLAVMWMIGLAAWYVIFFVRPKPSPRIKKRKPKHTSDVSMLLPTTVATNKESNDGADKDC